MKIEKDVYDELMEALKNKGEVQILLGKFGENDKKLQPMVVIDNPGKCTQIVGLEKWIK